MDDLAEARDTRVQRLRQADRALEDLAHFVGQHAEAVDGDDRARLVRIGEELNESRQRLVAAAASPATAATFASSQLFDVLEATAGAATEALQVLGARLARPEPWGEPSDGDERSDD
jgi:hypothetical protein